MKKLLKGGLVLLVLVVAGFGFYLYKLRALATEGNKLFEYRCTNVNPHLISYKNSFLTFADYAQNPDKYSEEEGVSSIKDYWDGMRAYVPEEDKWLTMQSGFVNRWDFKLFQPWYIKQAAEYQLKMYEGYRDDAKYLLATLGQGRASEEITAKQKGARDKRNQYSQLYADFFDKAIKINDWRKYLVSVPPPKGCNRENSIIPDTGGSIDWGSQLPSPTPFPNAPSQPSGSE